MKKTVFAALCLLFATLSNLKAQDVIVLKTGVEIKSKIEKLTPTDIEYKAFDNLDGPTIMIQKSTVFMLRYANGKTETINAIAPEKMEAEATPSVKKLKNELSASQSNKNQGFTGTLFVGGSLPLGSYAVKNLSDNEKAAGAKLGFTAGVQLGYRFNKSVSLLCEGQFALNSYDIQVEDVRYIYSLRGDWMHIAVLPSIRFDVPIANKVRFYGMASAGVSFAEMKGEFADILKYVDANTKATSFAYGLTVGCVFAEHVNLGIRYIGSNPAFSNYKPDVSTLQATLGYQF
jgi:hypothetical protein